jgi:hypothetical protein
MRGYILRDNCPAAVGIRLLPESTVLHDRKTP